MEVHLKGPAVVQALPKMTNYEKEKRFRTSPTLQGNRQRWCPPPAQRFFEVSYRVYYLPSDIDRFAFRDSLGVPHGAELSYD
jgi:hypothetical protein